MDLNGKIITACRQLAACTINQDMKKVREIYLDAISSIQMAEDIQTIPHSLAEIYRSNLTDAIIYQGIVEGLK